VDENLQLSSDQKYADVYRRLQFSLNKCERCEVDDCIISFASLFQAEMKPLEQHDLHEFLMLLKDLGAPSQLNLIHELFYGIATTKCKCPLCSLKEPEEKVEEFGNLIVDVPGGEQSITVRECMKDLFRPVNPEEAKCSCGAPATVATLRPERELSLNARPFKKSLRCPCPGLGKPMVSVQ
jgi:hypothetical protein